MKIAVVFLCWLTSGSFCLVFGKKSAGMLLFKNIFLLFDFRHQFRLAW